MNKETTAEEKESVLNTQNEQDTKMFNITMLPEKDISITVDTISKINVKVNKNVINEEYRKMITFCEPRPDKILNKFGALFFDSLFALFALSWESSSPSCSYNNFSLILFNSSIYLLNLEHLGCSLIQYGLIMITNIMM